MSQAIRKYQTGGKSSQEPELFEWKDVNKYNKSDLVSGLYRNIDTYIQNNGLKGDKADQFRKAAGQFIEGLKSGTVTMNGDGTFTDASGQMSSTGKYDKKFLGLGTKNTENNAFNRVGDYALSYIKDMSPYKAQVEEKPQTKAAPISFKQRLANIAMGGNWDDSLWRKFNSQDRLGFLRQAIQSSHNDFINNPEAEYNKDVFGTRENWIERSSNLLKALEDNKYNPEDLKFSAAMGYGDLGTYLNDEVQQQPTQGLQRPEGIDDDEWAKMQEAYKVRQARDKEARMQSYEDVINPKPTDEEIYEEQRRKFIDLGDSNLSKYNKIDVLPEVRPYDFDAAFESRAGDANSPWDLKHFFASYNTNPNAVVDGSIIKDVYNKNVRHINDVLYYVPDTTNAQKLSNNLDYWIREQERRGQEVERLPSGEYVIPHTYDAATGLIRVYDRNKRTLRYIQAHSTKTGRGLFESNYNESNKDKYAKWSKADGGVIKAQQGASLGYDSKAERAAVHEWYKQQQQANNAAKVEQSVASGKSPQQAVNDSRKPADTGFTASDYARLGAIGADLISMIPGAGVVGYAGTLANFGADWGQDGLDWGDVGRLAMNLGLDTVGLIPGLGAAAKGSKVVKSLIKWTPRLLSAAAAINYTGPGIESARKLATNPKDLSVDDYRNLAELIKVVVGGGKGVKRQIQSKQLRNAAATGNHVITSATGKEYTVTGAQLDEIASHGKLKDQQAAFQKITKSDDRLGRQVNFSWHNPFITSLPNSVVRPEYNFNKTKIVSTTKGDIEVPLVYSDSEKEIVKRMQTGVISIPGLDKLAQWYNSFKYRNLNKSQANGGVLIPKYQGGKAIRNVQSANDLNWNTDVLGSAGYNDTLGMINPANASTYNNMQRDYSNLGFTATKPGASRLSYNQNVANYQTNFNTNTKVNTGTMASLVKSGRITGRGGSSDKGTQWTADGYAGDQTWLRHLGTNNISADNLAKVRAGVNDNIDVVKNLDTGMLNFMPKAKAAGITSGNPQPAMPTKLESPVPAMGSNPTKKQIRDAKRSQKAAGDGTVRGAAGGEKKGLGGFSVLPEDVIALGRMVGGLATNNKAAEQYKAGLKPLLIDTYENTVPITGNYFAKASADRQASNLTSLAARPRTSDASLQLAGELEAQNKAGDIRFQGDMADADMFYKTRMMAQQESDAAKARRTDVANRNRASMLQIDAAKAQIDSAKTTANYQQVINPYLSGIENQFRQNRAARKQYDAESYRQGLLSTMQPQYDAAVQAGDTAKQQQLLRQYNTDMLNYSRNNVGMPWMFQRTTPSPNTPYTYAKGGRLTAQERIIIQRAKDFNRRMLADNKQFHKDIMAAKKQHADMIKHMSSLTSELIKKGMSWK